MAEIVSRTWLREAHSVKEPKPFDAEMNLHNIRIQIDRRRVTRRTVNADDDDDQVVVEESHEEGRGYISPYAYRNRDYLEGELYEILGGSEGEGGLGLIVDYHTILVSAVAVVNGLDEDDVNDEMNHVVVVLNLEVDEVEQALFADYGFENFGYEVGNADEEDGVEKGWMEYDVVVEAEAGRSECCAICWDGFFGGIEAVKLVPCDHVFHEHCIEDWFGRRRNCPICRKPIR